MRIILFIDFDGVTHRTPTPHGLYGPDIMFEYMPQIHQLMVDNPDLRIVVHSSWRAYHDDSQLGIMMFERNNVLRDRLLGATDRKILSRWESINDWILKNPSEGPFCIVDDDVGAFPSHITKNYDARFVTFIPCDPLTGLYSGSKAFEDLKEWVNKNEENNIS